MGELANVLSKLATSSFLMYWCGLQSLTSAGPSKGATISTGSATSPSLWRARPNLAQAGKPLAQAIEDTPFQTSLHALQIPLFVLGRWKDGGVAQRHGTESPSCEWWLFRFNTISLGCKGKAVVVDQVLAERAVKGEVEDLALNEIGVIKM